MGAILRSYGGNDMKGEIFVWIMSAMVHDNLMEIYY